LVFTLTVRGTRSTGNVFVHQRATEIVHACLQELPNAINADLYPSALHVNDVARAVGIGQSTNRMHQHNFTERWAAPRLLL
jgi:hypothetical protein